ncbi:hypothetical protein CDN99_21675 [Roseateles aquatilis]|uniref:Thioredoxin domain-containing protein n=1 Tax=Roseateles aquatilis TaxID=431061 RepID=A0A246IZA8_9BURK|nr:TlpA disulfide reductase family protein [Roseateles aquatilis]OWQ85690.1 hypothetical protein CDN99_21675 [Roseateles aquatilis]
MRPLILALAIGLGFAATVDTASAAERTYRALPNFSVAAGETFPLDGMTDPQGQVLPRKQLLGKFLLINFYTRHCAPCVKEVPKLNQVKARRADLNVLAITPDAKDEAGKYVQKHGLTWPVAADAEKLFNQLKVDAFPAFALLDANGRLVATTFANQLGGEDGHATVEGIEAWVDAQVKKASL